MISVVVPIFEGKTHLRQCIDSLMAQSYKDFEIILIDDGSPDECSVICDEYAQRDGRIKVIHKATGGLASARKTGLMNSQGEYITFVDGDDLVEENYLEQVAEAIENFNPDIVSVTDFYSVTDTEKVQTAIGKRYRGRYSREKLVSDVYPSIFTWSPDFSVGTTPSLWNKIIRRDLLEKYMMRIPEDIREGEDAAVVLPCMMDAEYIYFADICGYVHREKSTSIKSFFDESIPARAAALLSALCEVTRNREYPTKEQIEAYAVFIAEITLRSLLMKDGNIKEHLQSFDVLWKEQSLKDGMKRKISIKTRILLKMAQLKQGWFLCAVQSLRYHRKAS